MTTPTLADGRSTDEGRLECPNCGDTYLHQERVETYVRESEDATEGVHTTVDYGNGTHIDTNLEENPSGRRDGIMITFWCELCERDRKEPLRHALHIAQHKGEERIWWEVDV